MKVVRKERNESENQLLARYTEQRERILEEASHLAARKLGFDDKSYPDDLIFRNIERASKPGKKTRWAVDHDKILYSKLLE